MQGAPSGRKLPFTCQVFQPLPHQGWKSTNIKGASPPGLREGMSEQSAFGPGKSRMLPLISDHSCMLVLSQNFLLDLGPCSSAPSPHAKQIIRCLGCDGAVPAAWDCSSGMWDEWLNTPAPSVAVQQCRERCGIHPHRIQPAASQLKPQPY